MQIDIFVCYIIPGEIGIIAPHFYFSEGKKGAKMLSSWRAAGRKKLQQSG